MSSGANPEGVVELGIVATEVDKDGRGSDPKGDDEPRGYSMIDNTEILTRNTFKKENNEVLC